MMGAAHVLFGSANVLGMTHMVRILLEKGADACCGDLYWHVGSLMNAAELGFRDVCFLLVQYGANPHKMQLTWHNEQRTVLQAYGRGLRQSAALTAEQIALDCDEMTRLYTDFLERAELKRRRENMDRRMPLLVVLYGCGFRHLGVATAAAVPPGQKIPGIPRATPEQNRAYLLGVVLGGDLAREILTFV